MRQRDSSPPSGPALPRRIALWGLFGQQNIGNECTLQALIHNLRERVPGAELFIVCTDPEDGSKRHGLPALPISSSHGSKRKARRSKNLFVRLFRIVFRRIPMELAGWFRAFRALKGTDIVAMTGTGMLTDWSTNALGYPYDILKWTLVARLRGCRVRFLSVGVGPLRQRLSRWFIRAALSMADYRSYRDELSRTRLRNIGFESSKDRVFPDLAFSLPESLFHASRGQRGEGSIVGVGVMDYYGRFGLKANNDAIYENYLDRTCEFIVWLIEQGHVVRVLQGDMRYDQRPREDLRARLERRGFSYAEGRILDDDVAGVSDLLSQIASTDLVISPRFHNQILALMLGKPVISISYDPKSDALMEGLGLAEYCQPIEELDLERLIGKFRELERSFASLGPAVLERARQYRAILDEQYRLLLDGPAALETRSGPVPTSSP